MRWLTFAGLFLASAWPAGCGGRVDDPTPSSLAGSSRSTNVSAAGVGCAAACDRFRECTAAREDRDACIAACVKELPEASEARSYGTCIEALSCDQIERGVSMNWGPIGECWSKARRR